jgi:hypothetical protein
MLEENKRGAIEMSIGTIVTIVLAMSMLILGIVLIQNIFKGANENVLTMNDEVKDEISQLFADDSKTIVYLSNNIARIEQNEDWGVAFGISNLQKGTSDASSFTYTISVSDSDVQRKCGLSESEIERWIVTGRSDTIMISPGEYYYGVARFLIPEGAPLCTIRFHIDVLKDGSVYATDFFDIEVAS